MTYEIDARQLLIYSILVLYLGYFVKRHSLFLRKHSIPVSVVGGFLFSSVAAVFAGLGVLQLEFDLEIRNFLLLVFFSTIGLNARFRELVRGGKALVVLIVACGVFLVFQNVIGVSIATALGESPIFGLFGGSISLAGGHGTAIAWGEVAREQGIRGAAEFGIACATFGLILGGLLGGPIAGRLVEKHGLRPTGSGDKGRGKGKKKARAKAKQAPENAVEVPVKHDVSVEDVIGTVFALALCLALGDIVNRHLFGFEIRLPGFLTALLAGVVIANVADPMKVELNKQGLELAGGVSLQLFLAMSLMSMDLLSLRESAVLLLLIMAAQVAFAVVFATQVVFRLMGRDYDAAMVVGGFFGLGLGATPVAIASMDAVAKRHGPSFKALLIIPLVGAFFIDLLNAATIEAFLRLPFFAQ